MNTPEHHSFVYTPALIEFVAIGVKFAGLVERAQDLPEFVQQALTLLPRLYAQTRALPSYLYDPDQDYVEEYITEPSYERVRSRLETLLGEHDAFLSASGGEMRYSEEPILSHISECLADVYQHVGNLLGIVKEENEEALPMAIGRALLYEREYWGHQLLSALTALHQLYASGAIAWDQDEEPDGDSPQAPWSGRKDDYGMDEEELHD